MYDWSRKHSVSSNLDKCPAPYPEGEEEGQISVGAIRFCRLIFFYFFFQTAFFVTAKRPLKNARRSPFHRRATRALLFPRKKCGKIRRCLKCPRFNAGSANALPPKRRAFYDHRRGVHRNTILQRICFPPPALPRNKYHTNSRHAKLPSSKFIAANIFRGTGFTFVALSGKSAMWSSNARTAFHAAQHAARRYRLALRAGKHCRVGSPSFSSMAIARTGKKKCLEHFAHIYFGWRV